MEQKDKFDQLEAENQELLALTKQAFVKREVEKESVPADQEWEKFAAEHADELEALEKDEQYTTTFKRLMGILPNKVAASIIGILFTAGVAFAAIHIVRQYQEQETSQMEVTENMTTPATTVATDTLACDTVTVQPVIYDNIPLEKMLPEIATHYDAKVTFANDEARGLRFRFVWNPQQGIEQVVHDLNQFERLTVTLKDHQLIVE